MESGGSIITMQFVLFVAHLIAFVFCLVWLVNKHDDVFRNPLVGLSVLLCITWLLVGPLLVGRWEQRWRVFVSFLATSEEQDNAEAVALNDAIQRYSRWRYLVIALPMALMALAFNFGDSFFGGVLGLEMNPWRVDQGLPMIGAAWLIALLLGSLAAGWGVWFGVVTLVVAVTVSRQLDDFSPFAGVTSRSMQRFSEFCFGSAMIFAMGGAIVLPAFCAAVAETSGAAPWFITGLILLVIGMIVSLTAVPAYVISRQVRTERARYLDTLSDQIQELSNRILDRSLGVAAPEYSRLTSLLELRAHVVQHMESNAALTHLRLIPITVFVPVSTALTAWIGVLTSNG